MNVAPRSARERLRRVHRRVVVRLRRVDRRAERGDAVALHLRRGARDEDRRRHAEVLRRVRDAESVIAGRRRDDAARAHLGRQRREHVQRAAQLEGAGGLLVLELEVDVAAGDLAERARSRTSGVRLIERPDSVGGGEDVGGRRSAEHGREA